MFATGQEVACASSIGVEELTVRSISHSAGTAAWAWTFDGHRSMHLHAQLAVAEQNLLKMLKPHDAAGCAAMIGDDESLQWIQV